MAWTGGEYEEEEDGEQLDLTTINDVLAVTREDQEMLSEAHKALRREIKSIRKSLKSLVRQFYAYADAQESTTPERSGVDGVTKSGTGDLPTSSNTSTNDANNGHVKPHINVASERHRRPHLARSFTQPAMTLSQEQLDYLPSRKEDITQRSLSRNSVEIYDDSSVEDTTSLLDDLELIELSSTYPGSVSKSQNFSHTSNGNTILHQQKHSRSTTPRLRELGRKHAQLQFTQSDLPNGNPTFDGFGVHDEGNGVIIPELNPQLTSHLPPDIDQLKIPAQKTSTNGSMKPASASFSQFQTAPSQGHSHRNNMLHKTEEIDEPPPTPPPPPPPQDETNVYLLSVETDEVGSLPEFRNRFQSLPRRLSSSEITAISGGKRTKQIPHLRKLVTRRATHGHIAVTEVVM